MNKKIILILLAIVLTLSFSMVLVSCSNAVNIDHIEIYSMPKTEYLVGESLDITDAKILVVYKNNTESIVDINMSMLSDFNSSTLGTQYINVYFENHSAVFAVNVSRYPVSTVELVVPDENVNYIQDQLLRTEGAYMQINFQNGTYERIDVTKDMCSGYDSSVIGSQTITVRAILDGVEYVGSFVVTVEEKDLTAIEVLTAPTKNIYYVFDHAIDLRGGVLLFKYNSGYSVPVDMTDINGNPINGLSVEWDTSEVSNNSEVIVKYQGLTAHFQVQVKIRDVASYEILNAPKTQKQNLDLDLTGTVIKINYNNGESETVTLPSEKVEVQNYDKGLVGKQNVALVFKYGEGALATGGTMEITVEERKPLENNPFELVDCEIYQDTVFNISDIKVRIVFDNGEFGEPVALNNAMIEWPNGIAVNEYSVAGKNSWRITYMGITADCEFIVEALRVVEIELFNVSNIFAYSGDNALANVEGATMKVTYNSGLVRENVALEPEMLAFDSTTTGVKKATLTYTDEYESGFVMADAVNVTVVREVSSVVFGGSYKSKYILGEKFDPTGMVLEVNYEGAGEAEFVNASDFGTFWTFSSELEDGNLTFNKVGNFKIYIVNLGINADDKFYFTVEVTNDLVSLALYKIDDIGNYIETNSLGSVVQGVRIDLTDYRILATYQGSYEYVQVTDDMLDYNFKDNTLGQRKVVVTYEGLALADDTDPITVNVVARSVKGIKVIKSPDKTIYVQESSSSVLSYEGLKVNLVYDNDTTTPIDVIASVDDATLSFAGLDINKIGTQTITITYIYGENSYQDTFEIEVLSPEPKSISWSDGAIPESYVTIGAPFDLMTASYIGSEGYLERLADKRINVENTNGIVNNDISLETLIDNFTVIGYTATQTGLQTIQLKYGTSDLYLAVRVHVQQRSLKKINLIINGADKLTVIQGAPIDMSNLKLELVFNDDATSVVPMDASYINVSASNPNGYDVSDTDIGTRSVTISYTYANETTPITLTLTLEVYEKSLTEIVINDIPKQYYVEGEAYDKSQGSIMLYYNNGTTTIVPLAEATIGNDNSSFNIDIRRFNNEEFTGFSKAQRIEIKYGACKTSYTIYMRDRRNAFVEFGQDNEYSITYGSTTDHVIKLMGYANAFTADEEVKEFNRADFTIEYIPQEVWLDVGREYGVDYTIFPSKVGIYYIVVSYSGDVHHNAYEAATETLTINKKTLYVTIANASMVYGVDIPEVQIMLSEDGINFSNDPMSLFVAGDNFTSPNFNPEVISGTIVYLVNAKGEYVLDENGDKIAVSIFNIVYKLGNSVVDVSSTSQAGSYQVHVANQFVSPNYDIQYKYGALTINQRRVLVTPQNLEYTYGTSVVPAIQFTVDAVAGEEETTGLLPTDVLTGALSRENEAVKTVGKYKVTIGSLQTFNEAYYKIELVGEAYVRIIERTIYAKTDSIIKVYGEPFAMPAVKFYSDATCTIEDNAFAAGDAVELDGGILDVSKVGSVDISNIVYNESTPAGTYDDMAADFVLTEFGAANYKVILVAGVLEVSKRPVAVVADTINVSYGESATITYKVTAIEGDSASGLLSADMQSEGVAADGVFTGALDRISGTNVGEYTILIGDLASDNYAITFISAKYVIIPKALYVKIAKENLQKEYDGKKPVVTAYTLYEDKEGSKAYAEDVSAVAKSFINVIIENATKDVNTYGVRVDSNSNNYSVQTVAAYNYVITPRMVVITEADYVGIPNGLEYKGSAYNFYAKVSKSYLQHQYNEDGTIKTDDNNAPMYDDDSVTLSMASVLNAGTYTVSAIKINDDNYQIDAENTQPITFTLNPYTLKVVIKNCNEDNVFEREFNNQAAYLQVSDYEIENKLEGVEVPSFSLGIFLNGISANYSDVQYNSENGEIVGYEIRVVGDQDGDNYRIELKENYTYKIVPKKVSIRIYDGYKSKTYDGKEPSLTSGTFTTTEPVVGFNASKVSFTFERIAQDGRDNSTVGFYAVSIDCSDRNFKVSLDKPTDYEIKQVNAAVTLINVEKAYNGRPFRVLLEDLEVRVPYVDNVLNFYEGDGEGSEYSQFISVMASLSAAIQNVSKTAKAVRFSSNDYAISCINNAIEALNKLYYKDGENEAGTLCALLEICEAWSANNHANAGLLDTYCSVIKTCVNSLNTIYDSALDFLLDADEENDYSAQTTFDLSFEQIDTLQYNYDKANTYIAFVFAGQPVMSAKEGYTYTLKYSDINRRVNITNNPQRVYVNQFDLYILPVASESLYGDEVELNYVIKDGDYLDSNKIDPDTLEIIESYYNINISLNNYNTASLKINKVGTYTFNITIALKDSSLPCPYKLIIAYQYQDATELITHRINKVTLDYNFTLARNGNATFDGYEGKIEGVYGNAISYGIDYEDPKVMLTIGGNATDILKDFNFKNEDEERKILTEAKLNFAMYLDSNADGVADAGAEPVTSKFNAAGLYKLMLVSYESQNYEIKVQIDGWVKINKKLLTISTNSTKTYGSTYSNTTVVLNETQARTIEYVYEGFEANENAGNVKVFDNNAVEKGSLTYVQWGYTAMSLIDPFAADTTVAESKAGLAVELKADGFTMANYAIDFENANISIKVSRAPLTVSVVSTNNKGLSAYYMAEPSKDEYTIVYDGFRNGEDESILSDDIDVKVDFTNNGKPHNHGSHNIGIKINGADKYEIDNYVLTASLMSQFTVMQRVVKVTLNITDAVLTDARGNLVLEPYWVRTETTMSNQTKVTILRGQYGINNFVFELDTSDVTDEALRTEIENYYKNNVKVSTGYRSTTSGGDEGVFDAQSLYKHTITYGTITYGTDASGANTASAYLSGMSSNDTNFVFNPTGMDAWFEFTVYPCATSIAINKADGRLLASDLTKDSGYPVGLDKFMVDLIYGMADDGWRDYNDVSLLECLKAGYVNLSGSLPSAVNSSAYVTINLNSAHDLFKRILITEASSTAAINAIKGNTSMSVTDERQKTYAPALSSKILLRFFDDKSVEVTNPTIQKNGGSTIDYRKMINGNGIYRTTANYSYNTMHLEIAVKPTSSVLQPTFDVYLSGNSSTNTYVKLTFTYGITNAFIITTKLEDGSELSSTYYSNNVGNLFDGLTHDIRTYLDKEYLGLIVTIDGRMCADLSLATAKDTTGVYNLFTNASALVQSSKFELKVNGDFSIRYLKLTEQGMYEATGSHIKLPKISNRQAVDENGIYTLDAEKFGAIFGLYLADGASLTASYYVNGVQVFTDDQSSIDLAIGVHMLELALYDGTSLVDYQSTIVYVEEAYGHGYFKTEFVIRSKTEGQAYDYTTNLLTDVNGNVFATLQFVGNQQKSSVYMNGSSILEGVSMNHIDAYEVVLYEEASEYVLIVKNVYSGDKAVVTVLAEPNLIMGTAMESTDMVTIVKVTTSLAQQEEAYKDYLVNGVFTANGSVAVADGTKVSFAGEEYLSYDKITVRFNNTTATGSIRINLFESVNGDGAYLTYNIATKQIMFAYYITVAGFEDTTIIKESNVQTETLNGNNVGDHIINVIIDRTNREISVNIDGVEITFAINQETQGSITRELVMANYNKTSIVSEGQSITLNAYSVYSTENNAYVDKAVTGNSII